jgi:hypothetical protein
MYKRVSYLIAISLMFFNCDSKPGQDANDCAFAVQISRETSLGLVTDLESVFPTSKGAFKRAHANHEGYSSNTTNFVACNNCFTERIQSDGVVYYTAFYNIEKNNYGSIIKFHKMKDAIRSQDLAYNEIMKIMGPPDISLRGSNNSIDLVWHLDQYWDLTYGVYRKGTSGPFSQIKLQPRKQY